MKKENIKAFFKKHQAAALLALVVCMAFGITWAFYSDSAVLANPFGTAHSGAAMVEEFNPDSSFLPGETAVKKVAFENTGEMDLFLRVQVPPEEGWYEGGELLEDYDSGKVIKNWTESWIGETEADYLGADTSDWSPVFADGSGNSYRYYKKILEVDGRTADILESITLDPSVSNDRHVIDYSDKIYKLTFDAEAVPVDAPDADGNYPGVGIWNMQARLADDTIVWNSLGETQQTGTPEGSEE